MVSTEKHIQETLIDLMEEKPLEKIKVTELVQRADISRSTFYTYYDSIFAVLEGIEEEFLAHILEEKEVSKQYRDPALEQNFAYVLDHLRAFQVLLGPNGDPSFAARFGMRSKRILSAIATDQGSSLSDTQLTIVTEFSKAGKLQVFQWWSKHRNEVSVQEILEIMDQINGAIHGVVTGR